MFYYLEGTVAAVETFLAVIDCGGVGYACNTTTSTLSRLRAGEKARLYTYCHIREDIFDIYGFFTLNELNSFKMLIGISGVGPKAAISILSASSPEELALAIITGDEKALMVAQGIGKKIAQRIILELKDKLSKDTADISGMVKAGAKPTGAAGSKYSDAVSALTVLGYGRSEINAVFGKLDFENLSLEEIVRQSLKLMSL